MGRLTKSAVVVAALLALTACYTDGIWEVGTGQDQIPPGVYMSQGGPDCWEGRFDGGLLDADIVGANTSTGRGFIEILASDDYFLNDGCGLVLTPQAEPYTSYPELLVESDASHRIGVDMASGTWQSSGPGPCSWWRVSNWQWDYPDYLNVIDSATDVMGAQTVAIAPTDVGFESYGCGGWFKVV